MNYYKATFSVVTARRAKRMGIRVSRPDGYYVLIDPPVESKARLPGTERIQAWCKTKQSAETMAAKYREWQRTGCWGCPCGSGRQRRHCCGSSTATN
jgi:hypothetical protein